MRYTYCAAPIALHLLRCTYCAAPIALHLLRYTYCAAPIALHLLRCTYPLHLSSALHKTGARMHASIPCELGLLVAPASRESLFTG